MSTRTARWLIVCALAAAGCQQEATSRVNPLLGVWSVVEFQEGAAGGQSKAVRTQPGQFIFTQTRYAAVWVLQAEPRAVSAKPWEPITEEKLAHFASIVANSGTYDVSGSRLTIRPIVAKMPEFAGGHLTYEFRIEGDYLVLEAVEEKSAGNIAPPNYEATRERLRLRRIEDK